jgi:hypothetical protein
MNRKPIIHTFSAKEAEILGKAYHKKMGQPVRGDSTAETARQLELVGLVSIEDIDYGGAREREKYRRKGNRLQGGKHQGGILVKVTSAGREAWINAGLIAAGRQPKCLD